MSLTNFVQLQLQSGITAVALTMTVLSPVAPFKLPDASGTLVLLDGLTKPSKAEVVTYTGLINNGNGTHTFTGLGRGAESSTAQGWSAQAYVIESVTAGMLAAMFAAKQDAGSNLTALSGLAGVADRLPYFTGAGALSLTTLTALARNLLDDTTQSGMQSTLGLVKQTSATDTTAGALMAVGAFGLGAYSVNLGAADADAITANGMYYSSTWTNGWSAFGHLSHIAVDSDYAVQTFYGATASSRGQAFRVNGGGTWGAWTEVVTGVKQTSATDTTDGALMAVGAFGLGASALPLLADTLEPTTTGIFRFGPDCANLPTGAQYGTLFHQSYDAPYLNYTQLIIGVGPNKIWQRSFINGTTQGWQEIYSQSSILGAVSQSGGVPTGAVIERGSNVNGEYIRWADGTQLCWRMDTIDRGFSTSYGALFRTNILSFAFPADFAFPPVVAPLCGSSSQLISGAINNVPNNSSVSVCATSASSDAVGRLGFFASGRWY